MKFELPPSSNHDPLVDSVYLRTIEIFRARKRQWNLKKHGGVIQAFLHHLRHGYVVQMTFTKDGQPFLLIQRSREMGEEK